MPKPSFRDLPSELEGLAPPAQALWQAWSKAAAVRQQIADLAGLYGRMDDEYAKIARMLEFDCHNCSDNCCRQTFHHFTWAEYIYLLQGLFKLPPARRTAIFSACRRNLKAGPNTGALCGANHKGLCQLYAHRPMICRLHGVAYCLVRPDGRVITGPGCLRFEACHHGRTAQQLDRTPFYTAMARLEQDIRQQLALSTGLKLTVSQMLLTAESWQ